MEQLIAKYGLSMMSRETKWTKENILDSDKSVLATVVRLIWSKKYDDVMEQVKNENGDVYRYCEGWIYKRIKEYALAYRKFTLSSEFPASLSCLGDLYLFGDFVIKDENKAVDYFKKAMKKGSIRSYLQYGQYMTQIKNIYTEESYNPIRYACENGDIDAYGVLVLLLTSPEFIKKNGAVSSHEINNLIKTSAVDYKDRISIFYLYQMSNKIPEFKTIINNNPFIAEIYNEMQQENNNAKEDDESKNNSSSICAIV
jgi:hypothetical protein